MRQSEQKEECRHHRDGGTGSRGEWGEWEEWEEWGAWEGEESPDSGSDGNSLINGDDLTVNSRLHRFMVIVAAGESWNMDFCSHEYDTLSLLEPLLTHGRRHSGMIASEN